MAASGTPFQGPRACPFVALELDRDRRSERPDYRHRCYAEPTPAPRSIAHQEAYCLAPGFAACPIFQDWAERAAAAPVGGPARDSGMAPPPAPLTATAPVAPAAMAAAQGTLDDPSPAAPSLGEPSLGEPPAAAPPLGEPPLVMPAPPARETQAASTAWDDVSDAEQLSVFDAAPQPATHGAAGPRSSFGEPDAGYVEPSGLPLQLRPEPEPEARDDYVPPPARREAYSPPPVEEPAMPPFLAGRAPRAASSPLPAPRSSERMSRDEIVPSWDIDGRYGAQGGGGADDDGGGSRLDTILTGIAVIAILALGIAGVIFLPGLLAGSPGRTPAPSFALPSPGPSVAVSAAPSVAVTPGPATQAPSLEPSAAATPQPSMRQYRIKPGDSLARIARRFDITVEDLLAANPQIEDPNHIQVGQVISIPPASGS